jgi:hypothetical protein
MVARGLSEVGEGVGDGEDGWPRESIARICADTLPMISRQRSQSGWQGRISIALFEEDRAGPLFGAPMSGMTR